MAKDKNSQNGTLYILFPTITLLINKSIFTGCFPPQMKLSKVFPIHKDGVKDDPSNYRPISILPTISKILKKKQTRQPTLNGLPK